MATLTGTAGTPTPDVVSVQGITNGTAIPVSAAALPLPTGAATEAKQDTLIGHVDGIETAISTLAGHVDGLEALATTLNSLITTLNTSTDGLEALLTTLGTYVDGLEGKDYATQTTLAAVLAKLIAAPATEAKQDDANTLLTNLINALTASASPYCWLMGNSNNANVMKASPGTLLALNCNNTHATNWLYVKFYNKTTAPDPSTDTPYTTLAVPPGRKEHLALPTNGAPFSVGISWLAVTGAAHTDNTAVASEQGIMYAVYR